MKALNKLILHILQKEDLAGIIKTFTFPWSSLQATQEKWERYYTEQQTNIRTVCIAKIGDEFIGYGSLLNNTEYQEFKNFGIPDSTLGFFFLIFSETPMQKFYIS